MLGVDLVDVARLRRALARAPGLGARTFSPAEFAVADARGAGRDEFLAGRFAAKEATLKAYGAGIADGVVLAHVEVLPGVSGVPAVRLTGAAADLAARRGLHPTHVSISHEAGLAVAVVLLAPTGP